MSSLLQSSRCETYGWTPDPALSEDENLMDLVLIVTRSSQLKQGSMACILIQPPPPSISTSAVTSKPKSPPSSSSDVEVVKTNDDDEKQLDHSHSSGSRSNNDNNNSSVDTIWDRIVSIATNQSIFKENDSDVHAEIAAISLAAATKAPSPQVEGNKNSSNYASSSNNKRKWEDDVDDATDTGVSPTKKNEVDDERRGVTTAPRERATPTGALSTTGATAYITMPPCKRCLGALVVAGIKRIVSRYAPSSDILVQAAQRHGIEIVAIQDTQQQRDRIQRLVMDWRSDARKTTGSSTDRRP